MSSILGLVHGCDCSPWNDALYKDAAEMNDMGYLSLNGFLSKVGIIYTVIFSSE